MTYDVIVIGGGITGAGVLRDCARRGLRALLLEMDQPGHATTRASTHLIHGGLRYLLYDRLTTHATSWDAGNIVRIARPWLKRLPILWPVYRGHAHGLETAEALLKSYDAFQRMKEGRPHLRLAPSSVSAILPAIRSEGLLGALSFDEWWVDAVGLVEKNLDDARSLGAELRKRTRVKGLLRKDGNTVTGVAATGENGATVEFGAKVVVNAAGPWADTISRMAGIRTPLTLRRGTHLVYDRPLVPCGLLLEAADKERYVFVVPYPEGTLVGPTDLPEPSGPDGLAAAPEEISYLLNSVRRYLPDFPDDFAATRTGVRPLLCQTGSEKLLSREYEVHDHASDGVEGFLTVAGGKMSDFRLMAKDAVDLACAKMGQKRDCRTHLVSLDGSPLPPPRLHPRPSRPLKRFLRSHPRLREGYSLCWLAAAFAAHCMGRLLLGTRESSSEKFREHYGPG